MAPKTLVGYASANGSTRGVAEAIARVLTRNGVEVDLRSLSDEPRAGDYHRIVLGSAIHNRAWLPVAERYVRGMREALGAADVWLFSVGLGPMLRGPIGRRLGRVIPPKIDELRTMVGARDHRLFAGVFPREGVSLGARVLFRAIGGGGRYGDFRDWDEIEAWAAEIALATSEFGTNAHG
ncbi:flavodoxin [Rhodococcus maanshanensis]|nr:flavodoxin domain-containing protein [Rhodococcus maanshanensis]MCZ4558747.1 flavodoxin [Rhodococcus maanshanensis]